MNYRVIFICICLFCLSAIQANTITVGKLEECNSIKEAIKMARPGDTILVESGLYKEGNITIDKKLVLLGLNYPVIDGDRKFEVITIKSDSVIFKGFQVQHSGYATLDDPGGIKVMDCNYIVIEGNILHDNFFGIYIHYGKHCIVRNNRIKAFGKEEQSIGNGIHCWKSDSLQITANQISGHRDGIYFEFVTHSVIWRNISKANIRYGLHFMFSNDDAYIANVFKNNGAGVAVMFTNRVKMFSNYFEENWGDAAYGLLLKEISDSYIIGNVFKKNTMGIYMEGTNRILVEKNKFLSNGWAMKVQASCMDNTIRFNDFMSNTFDVGTNGSLVLNTFANNYWDKYEGYDLNKDKIGDIPFRPLSLFSILIERAPSAMLLFRSFMITLLDRSEKMLPSITPDNFIDNEPYMHPVLL